VGDFTRQHHVVTASPDGFAVLAPAVVALAEAEGLDAHAESIRLRSDS
jgi:histidinol dehydrogenase